MTPSSFISAKAAAAALVSGHIVALPTETVYGLAARALDADAVHRIFLRKGRPADNPVIVHVASMQQAQGIAEVSSVAERLMQAFWPGPLTVVLPAKPSVPDVVTAGLSTVAVRQPSHPVFQEVLLLVGEPLAAPSANPSGQPSPTCAEHVLADYAGEVPVVDGGPCVVGVESTVVQPFDDRIVLLRPGSITRQHIAAATGLPVTDADQEQRAASPGTRYRHYAPHARVRLCNSQAEVVACLAARSAQPTKVLVLSPSRLDVDVPQRLLQRATLYDELRSADQLAVEEILVHCDADVRADEALMDRLERAAEPASSNS